LSEPLTAARERNAPSDRRRRWGNLAALLRRYAWPHRLSYAGGFLFLAVTNYLAVSIPEQIGHGVDALRAGAPLGRYAAMIAIMGAVLIATRTLSRVLIFNPGRDLEYNLRTDLFHHLMELQPSFYATRNTGDIVSRASNDITWVRAMVGFGGLALANVVVATVLTMWKMFTLSPQLTVLVLLPVGVGLAVVQLGIRRLFDLQRASQEALADISDHVLGSFQGIASIQGFVAEPAFIDRFETRNRRWLSVGIRVALIRSLALPLMVLSGGLAVVALIHFGGQQVIAGALTVGQLAAFATLLAALLPPLRSLGWMLSVVQRGQAALERIFELMEAPVERPEGQAPAPITAGKGPSIELDSLTFAYPDQPERPVLHDLSATIPAGSVVGIFGRTGSGKTTLMRLLARLYNPPPGMIRIDGTDLTAIDLEAWRERLAVVEQRPFLFSDTLAANVALAGRNEPERLEDAIQRAALGPDLERLPDGLDTLVGQRGIMLSGGQRQRVALARGLYRGGDLLILDDVLSAVDHTTEQRLLTTLHGLGGSETSPTIFIVAHRLSAIRHADQILVLDDGRLVDQGRHDELVARPGLYADTWQVQSSAEASDQLLAEVAAS
jgi:ATP-binding cassette subfamily B protein